MEQASPGSGASRGRGGGYNGEIPGSLPANHRPRIRLREIAARSERDGFLVANAGARHFSAIFPTAHAERVIVKEQLESLIGMMVERGILLEEAVTEFEKKFIKRVLERQDGNQSRAAKVLGIHRNTLSRKVGEYKLDHAGGRKRG